MSEPPERLVARFPRLKSVNNAREQSGISLQRNSLSNQRKANSTAWVRCISAQPSRPFQRDLACFKQSSNRQFSSLFVNHCSIILARNVLLKELVKILRINPEQIAKLDKFLWICQSN